MFQASRESLKYTVFASVSIQCGQKSNTGIILRADNDGPIQKLLTCLTWIFKLF